MLLANTYKSKTAYRPDLWMPQWEKIMEYYFRKSHGLYAELTIVERILLAVLRSQWPHELIGDMYLADRFADYYMMSDAMLILKLLHWKIQLGIQIWTGKHAAKISDFSKRPLDDNLIQIYEGPIDAFRRDVTAAISFPLFRTSERSRERALHALVSWSQNYQSQMIIAGGNKRFLNYGHQVGAILWLLHECICDRIIEGNGRFAEQEFVTRENALGEVMRCVVWDNNGLQVVTITYLGSERNVRGEWRRPKFEREKRVQFSLPLPEGGDFLDKYRDLAGIRAQ